MPTTWRDDDPDAPEPVTPPPDPRYDVGEVLGRGGTAQVHSAHDKTLRRDVALKVLTATGPGARDRFLGEAQVTAQLQHPGIPPVHDLGQLEDGRPFLSMKRVEGLSLHDWAQRDPRPSLEARLEVLRRVCDAVGFAHAQGFLHRDLKPENIMVGAFGEVLVMDWGLARPLVSIRGGSPGGASDRDANRTLEGNIAGTPAFMAPEQAEGRLADLDARTDVYALGGVLYALLTGVPAFSGAIHDVLADVRAGRFVPPRSRVAGIPRELDAVVCKAMALRPDDRYPSAAALRDDLGAWIAREPLITVRSSWSERAAKWARRHRGAVRAAGAVAAAASAGLLVGAWRYSADVGAARDAAVGEAARARTAEADARQELARAELALSDAHAADGDLAAARTALDRALATVLPGGRDALAAALADAVLAAESPPPLSICRPHGDGGVGALALRADAGRVASWGLDGRVAVWDPLGCAVEEEREVVGAPGYGALAFGAGGLWAALVVDQALVVLSPAGAPVTAPLPGTVGSIGIDGAGAGWLVTREGRGYRFGADAVFAPLAGPPVDTTWRPDGALLVGSSVRSGAEPAGAWTQAGRPLWLGQGAGLIDADARGVGLAYANSVGVGFVELGGGTTRWERAIGPTMRVEVAAGDRVVVAIGFDGQISVLSADDGAQLARLAAASTPTALAASADARVVAVAIGPDVTTWLRPLTEGRHLRARLSASGHGLAVSADGAFVAASDDAGQVVLADAATGVSLRTWALGGRVRDLAFSPEGDALAATVRGHGLVVMALLTGETRELPLPLQPTAVAWPEPARLVVGSADGELASVAVESGHVTEPLVVVPGGLWDFATLPDGTWLAGGHDSRGVNPVLVADLDARTVRATLPNGTSSYRVAATADGQLAAIGRQGGNVTLWSPATGEVRAVLDADDGPTLGVAFSPDGTLLATTGFGGRVRVWDVASAEPLRALDQHGGPGTNVAFSPDGEVLYSMGSDLRVGALDLVRGRRHADALAVLTGGGAGRAAAFAALGWWERVLTSPDADAGQRARAQLALGAPVVVPDDAPLALRILAAAEP